MFKALVLEEMGGTVTASVRELEDSELPAGNVTVAVEYTTVNYKDGLVINGGGGLVNVGRAYLGSISQAACSKAPIPRFVPATGLC